MRAGRCQRNGIVHKVFTRPLALVTILGQQPGIAPIAPTSAMLLRPLPGLVLAASLAGSLGAPAARAQPDAPPVAAPQQPVSAERLPIKLRRLAALLAQDGAVRIVAFGSSSTEGAGASSPAMAYPALLERDLKERLQIGLGV